HFTTLNCEAWAWVGQGFPAMAAQVAEKARQASASREWAVSVFWTNCTLALAYSAMGRLDDARRALPRADPTLHKQDQLSLWGAELQLVVAGGRPGAGVGDRRPAAALLQEVTTSALEREHWWQQEQARHLADRLGIRLVEDVTPAREEEPQATGERFVTVLFADVRGYSAMTRKVAPAV